jgi:hypothetical protein
MGVEAGATEQSAESGRASILQLAEACRITGRG